MTERQLQLLDFISDFIKARGFSPSYREMMNGIGATSTNTVFRLVNSLEEQGKIKRLIDRARTIEVIQ